MLRAGLIGLLLIAPTPLSPLTTLTVDAPSLPAVQAGEHLEHELTVQLDGPLGPMPGLATEVNLTLEAPGWAGCYLPSTTQLNTISGEASVTLACRPLAAGQATVTVTASSPPHGTGHWDQTLTVDPDTLLGELSLDAPEGYEVPVVLDVAPEHLDTAAADLTLSGDLEGSPLGFVLEPTPITLDSSAIDRSVLARHGPGNYSLTAHLDGPDVEPLTLTEQVHVPAPPEDDELELNVTVEPGEPSVNFTDDSVNADGKRKRPGDTLITRLETTYAETVNVTVTRSVGNASVMLARETLEVDASGEAEHRFTHDVLPSGLLRVTATAGNSSVTRTAQIQDLNPDASATLPAEALADGRTLSGTITLEDPNHGSTPMDPGPIWGLPDVTWRVLKGSLTAEGFNVSIGPFSGGPEGTAETSRVPWPNGTSWADVTDGQAEIPVEVTPPLDVDPGTYTLSLYDPDGDRLGGASIELTPTPTLGLDAETPLPGEPWRFNVTISDPVPGTSAHVVLNVTDEDPVFWTFVENTSKEIVLPEPMAAGANVTLNATGDWPGRPSPPTPDAALPLTIPDVPPELDLHPSVDEVPVPAPLALHPAAGHTVRLNPQAVDPNGDPVETSARVLAPDGTATGWANVTEAGPVIEVPAGPSPGRYTVEATATSQNASTTRTLALDVGEITRVRLAGPTSLTLNEGASTTTEVTLTNAGTVPLTSGLIAVDADTGLDVALLDNGTRLALDEPVPLELAPGMARTFTLEVTAAADAEGARSLRLTAAGVAP